MAVIAVDIMGSDAGPLVLMEGVSEFHRRSPECQFLIFGHDAFIQAYKNQYSHLASVADFIPVKYFVKPDVPLSSIMRIKDETTMGRAIRAVADGEADGVLSAGHTGAYLALSRSSLKTLPGIDRPAIISQIPTRRGEVVMLDLGGSLEASSQALVEYAVMGNLFAQKVMGVLEPSIGLLNVGKEHHKGKEILQVAAGLLRERTDLKFYGFIEGDDIGQGVADVVVTDGFTGNVALKTGEGMLKLVFWALQENLKSSWLRGLVLGTVMRPLLKELKAQFDPRAYNGALWLGLNGVAVKSHGGTDGPGFAHALDMVYDMIKCQVVTIIGDALAGIVV